MWRKNWTHVFPYFFFDFNGIVLRKNNKKMIEPTLVGENSFGKFDDAQFAGRLFMGQCFVILEENFLDPTSGLISYYIMFAKQLNTF